MNENHVEYIAGCTCAFCSTYARLMAEPDLKERKVEIDPRIYERQAETTPIQMMCNKKFNAAYDRICKMFEPSEDFKCPPHNYRKMYTKTGQKLVVNQYLPPVDRELDMFECIDCGHREWRLRFPNERNDS